MKNNLVKTVIVMITLAMFSSSVLAQSVGDGNSSGSNSEQSVNNSGGNTNNIGCLVNCTNGEDSDRALDGPVQTENRVHYSGEYDVNTVPDVSAPGLTTTLTETCMGSTSAGGAVVGFGFSFGTTWRDSACVRRLDSRQMMALGYNLGAKELMCDSAKVRAALQRAGKPCFADLPEEIREEINPQANEVVINQEVNQRSKEEYELKFDDK